MQSPSEHSDQQTLSDAAPANTCPGLSALEAMPTEIITLIMGMMISRGGNPWVLARACKRFQAIIDSKFQGFRDRVIQQLQFAHSWQDMYPGKLAVWGLAAFWIATGCQYKFFMPDYVNVVYLGGPDDELLLPTGDAASKHTEMEVCETFGWTDTHVAIVDNKIRFYRSRLIESTLEDRFHDFNPTLYSFVYTDYRGDVLHYNMSRTPTTFDECIRYKRDFNEHNYNNALVMVRKLHLCKLRVERVE